VKVQDILRANSSAQHCRTIKKKSF